MNDARAAVSRHEKELRQAFEVQIEERARLDAALKRIAALELQLATLDRRTFAELARDMSRPSAPIDQEDV